MNPSANFSLVSFSAIIGLSEKYRDRRDFDKSLFFVGDDARAVSTKNKLSHNYKNSYLRISNFIDNEKALIIILLLESGKFKM
ncbi:hypothetical protein EMIT036CA2_10187 [Chryseobacterium sp. IT-36CA2]